MRRIAIALCGGVVALVPTVAFAAPGDPDPGFGTSGVVTGGLLDEFGQVTVDGQGRTVVVGRESDTIAIARYLGNGSPDPAFSGDGRVDLPIAAVSAVFVDVRVLADGSIVAIGQRRTTVNPFSNALWSAKVSDGGVPDSGYDSDGASILEQGFTAFFETGSIAADGSAVITEIGIGGGWLTTIDVAGAFDDTHALEFAAGALPAGCVPAGFGYRPFGSARLPGNEAVHVLDVGVGDTGGCTIENAIIVTKQNLSTDDPVWSYAILPPDELPDQRQGVLELIGSDILVSTMSGATSHVHRLSSAGAPVAGWGAGGRATLEAGFGAIGGMAPMADGSVAVVNDPLIDAVTTLRVDRLLADGSTDPAFGHYTAPVGGFLTGTSIAGAPDGDIAVTTQRTGEGTVRHIQGASIPDAVPLAPARLLDTRPGESTVDGQFAGIGRAAGGSVTKVRIAGRGGVPADAAAAMVNLTVVSPGGAGYATIFPCTPTPPNASNINYTSGSVVANSVTATLDANGDACIFTLAAADLLIDSNGFVPSDSGIGTLTPARLLDTRPGETTVDGQFAGIGQAVAGSVTKVRVAGRGGIPVDATAAMVNLTVVNPGGAGYATIYPCTPTPPNASNINYGPGTFVANSVTATLDSAGDVCVFTLAAADILIDANAYAEAGSQVGTLTPARLLDTRPGEATADGQFAGIGQAAAGSVTKVHIAGRGGIPTDATAAIVNLTIVGPGGPGYATIYPCTPTPPNASNINYGPGAVVANGALAKLDAGGDVCIFTLAAADIIVDANGYLTA